MASNIIHHAVPLTTRLATGGGKAIVARDKARAQRLLAGRHHHGPAAFLARKSGGTQQDVSAHSVDVTDAAVTYTIPVGVGSPPTDYTLIIDTGSSNTWIGAEKKYHPTKTSKNTHNAVHVKYGSGEFWGTEYIDQVTLGKNLVIKKQSIGVASTTKGFQDVDGILGIGPIDLTQGTVKNTPSVPTVVDNLYTNHTIPTDSISISFNPSSTAGVVNGELTFGGVDDARYTGKLNYVPITKKEPASHYWGIDQTLTYGSDTTILDSTAGIVDTGTTLLLIATDAYNRYVEATGAVYDDNVGLLSITQEQYDNLKSLNFKIGEINYELTANAQIWPRALNTLLGGDAHKIYLITADMGEMSGSGLDFIDGFGFLQRFYSVYDTSKARLGLATTKFTNAESN